MRGMENSLTRKIATASVSGCRSLVAVSMLLLAACNATAPVQKTSQIQIQDQVGFTIVEEATVRDDDRNEYNQALRYLEQGDLVQGIQILEEIVLRAPQIAAPHVDLGVAHHLAGNLDAAEQSLQSALDLNPGHPMALNELGIVYRKSGRFVEARRSYEAALAVYPGYHYAQRNLAVLCDLYLADQQCAMKNYEAYMATVPSDDEVSMWMTDLRYRMGQGE